MESVYFPPGKAGNVLRGALGPVLADLTAPGPDRPSGLADPPRPFVFRAAHLNGKRFQPDETFYLDLNLFELRAPLIETFVRVFSEWATTGLGPRRGRVELFEPPPPTCINLDLTAAPSAVSKCSVAFQTPTELKGNPANDRMPFGVLFARIRDRISTLSGLYGEGPLPIDFQAMAERANNVRTVKCDLHYQNVVRRSSRTGAVHSIGGVEGQVDYEGELAEFVPWLNAARYTGVGRHTVWGNGQIEVLSFE